MSSHTTNRAHQKDAVTHDGKNLSYTELSPPLQSLLSYAKEKYTSYMEVAQEFDDSQEKFCSTAVNTLKGHELLAKIALRSKNITD